MDALIDGLNLLLHAAKELRQHPNGARVDAARQLAIELEKLLDSQEALAAQSEERGLTVYALGRISLELVQTKGFSRTALRQIRATTEAVRKGLPLPAPAWSQLPSEVLSRLRDQGLVAPFVGQIPSGRGSESQGAIEGLNFELPGTTVGGDFRVGSGLEGETTFEPEQKPPPPKKNS
jgi:hypothetical protein